MYVLKVNWNDFIDVVEGLQYQNQDVLEVKQFGFKSVEDAYRKAQLPWARFYLIEDDGVILATILEQRDGVLTFFTTVDLPGKDMKAFTKLVRKLADEVTKCREVLFVRVASWYKPAKALLRLSGFRKYTIHNHSEIWVKEYGK